MSPGRRAASFGMVVRRTDPALVRGLEAAGAESLWVGGRVGSAVTEQEVVVELARLSALVESRPIGAAVVVLPWYPPGVLARQLALIEHRAQAELVVGVGVGGDDDTDFRAAGVPMGQRGARAEEAIAAVRAVWSGRDHRGEHFDLTGVRAHPAPAGPTGPPLVVAGRRAGAMRRAARLGDGWMPFLYSPERYADSRRTVERLGAEAGGLRPGFRWMLYLPVLVGATTAAAEDAARDHVVRRYGPGAVAKARSLLAAGDPDVVVARLREYREAGVDGFVLQPLPAGGDEEASRLLLTEVIPAARAELRGVRLR